MILHTIYKVFIGSVVLALILSGCQQSADLSGGLETTNGFVTAFCSDGVVSGSGKPGTRLALCEESFTIQDTGNPVIRHCIVKESGDYSFTRVPNGTYNLLCWDDEENTSIFIPGIESQTEGALLQDTLHLAPSAVVLGTASFGKRKDSIVISLVGTPLSAITDVEGHYSLSDVPIGKHSIYATLNALSLSPDLTHFETQREVIVSGDSLSLHIPELQLTRP